MNCILCKRPLPPDHAGVHGQVGALAEGFVHAACRDLEQQGRALVRRALKRLGLPDPDEREEHREAANENCQLRAELTKLRRAAADWQVVADRATASACKVAADLADARRRASDYTRERDDAHRQLAEERKQANEWCAQLHDARQDVTYLRAAVTEERGRVAGLRDALAEARGALDARHLEDEYARHWAERERAYATPEHATNCAICDQLQITGQKCDRHTPKES